MARAGTNGYTACIVERVLMTPQGGVVLLAPEQGEFIGKVLPVFVDVGQAVNIQMGRTSEMPPRPFTHDLITTILNELGGMVTGLSIDDLAQNTFFATLSVEIEKNGRKAVEKFDARPSDGIALALRADAPIRVAQKVLDEAAVDASEFFSQTEGPGGA